MHLHHYIALSTRLHFRDPLAIIAQLRLLNYYRRLSPELTNRGADLSETATVKVAVICAKVSLAGYSYDLCSAGPLNSACDRRAYLEDTPGLSRRLTGPVLP